MKNYIVRLTDDERKICEEEIGRLEGSSQQARSTRILLQVNADGPSWTDRRVADAFLCTVRTFGDVRKRCVPESLAMALNGKRCTSVSNRKKLLEGKLEA